MAQYTPMIQQYIEIKKQVPDAFLFFRLGDFYEMFFEDATLASQELEITLTGRSAGIDERIPMCGVPYHSAEGYIARLIEKGYKVAICEQVEDPSQSKGVVKREIVRIVTPGTYMDSKKIQQQGNNYMVSIAFVQHEYGLSACDVSTGELLCTHLSGSLDHVLDEAVIYEPSEMIVEHALVEPLRALTSAWTKPPVINGGEVFAVDATDQQESSVFSEQQWNKLRPAGQHSVKLLMDYLRDTQKRSLTHIREIRFYENDQYMRLDPFTRRNLELVETVRDRSRKGSLLWLLDETVTAMGARHLKRWLDKPLLHKERIEQRLEAVECLYHQLMVRDELRQYLKNVYDLERLVGKIAYGSANAKDLVSLKISLQQLPKVIELCLHSGSNTLRRLVEQADPCTDIMERIEQTIVDDPPVSVKEGGMIRTGCEPYLDQLKEASVNGKQWIAELEQKEREATGIKSLKVGYNKVFGYYIEVTRANLASLPEGRYERKQTLANAERFITPELKEKEALILEAEEKMVDLEYELFCKLRESIEREIPRLQLLSERICEIDVYQSLATVSAKYHYTKPSLVTDRSMRILEGRHPVVEAMMEEESFIANDTVLDEKQMMMLITGPNMAGKSTYMRQVAMISIMAQIGCFVPAEQSELSIVDRIFTRIGAADDLASGQSTFMVEMRDIQLMTEKATKDSLVIIDELGRGTSTEEGMAIAQAVIEYLHEQIGCKTLVSTHYHELSRLEDSLSLLKNYSMAVKESDGEVTFLRKLIRGAASSSYGIYCAQIAGLPAQIIDRAYALLSEGQKETAAAEETSTSLIGEVQQMSFFEPVPSSENDSHKEIAAKTTELERKAKHLEQEISREVDEVDLMSMTPLEAMQWIHQLKLRLKKERQ